MKEVGERCCLGDKEMRCCERESCAEVVRQEGGGRARQSIISKKKDKNTYKIETTKQAATDYQNKHSKTA